MYKLTFEEYQKFFDNHLNLYWGFGRQHKYYTKFFDEIEEKQKEFGYTSLKLQKINDPLENLETLDIGVEHFNNILTPEHLNKIFDRYNNLHNYINHFVETVNYNIDILFDEDEDKSGLYLSSLDIPNANKPYAFSYKNENASNYTLSYNTHIKYLYDLKDLYTPDDYTRVNEFLSNKLENLVEKFINNSKYNYSQGKSETVSSIFVNAVGPMGIKEEKGFNTRIWVVNINKENYSIKSSLDMNSFSLSPIKEFDATDRYYLNFNKNSFIYDNTLNFIQMQKNKYGNYVISNYLNFDDLILLESYSAKLNIKYDNTDFSLANISKEDNIGFKITDIKNINLNNKRFPEQGYLTKDDNIVIEYSQEILPNSAGIYDLGWSNENYPNNIGLYFGNNVSTQMDPDTLIEIGTIERYSRLFKNIGDFDF